MTHRSGRKEERKEGEGRMKEEEGRKTNICGSKSLHFELCFIIADF